MVIAFAIVSAALAACGVADTPTLSTAPPAAAAIEKGSTGAVYRFAKQSNGAYFYTGNAGERDIILASYPDFRYEGVAFQQYQGAGGAPVYRFANLATGGYFYTASAWERDFVRATRTDMRPEGTTFSVADPVSPGAMPVFRLANLGNGAYLYTSVASERDAAIARGTWRSEGIAFYAPPIDGFLACPDNALASAGSCVCLVSGQRYDLATNLCATPPVIDVPVTIASGWHGDYVDGGGGDGAGAGDGGGGDGGGAGGGSSLGILKKARVEIYYPKNGVLLLAAAGETDPVKGMVTIRAGTYTGPALAVFKGQAGATYYDEGMRAEVPFPEGRELNVMLASLTRNFGATLLTEAAFQYALQIYGDPRIPRETNLVRILTPQRIQVASDLVRNQFNAMLPTNTQITDIARLPYLIGAATKAGAVPDTANGLYAIVLSALAVAAKNYNEALVMAGVPTATRTTAPAFELMQQLTYDLIDGRIDTVAGNAAVADFPRRLYSLSVAELIALGVSTQLTLPSALAAALQTSIARYASDALTRSIGSITIPPPPALPAPSTSAEACSGTTYPLPGGGSGCCPAGSTVANTGGPSGYSYCVPPPPIGGGLEGAGFVCPSNYNRLTVYPNGAIRCCDNLDLLCRWYYPPLYLLEASGIR